MAKQLNCDCGFYAGGGHTTLQELEDIAVQHTKAAHPEMLQQQGEKGIRAMTPKMVKEV